MSDEYRHQCEIKHWWRETDGDAKKINAVLARIAKRRGQAAADRLRDGMREEWRRQNAAK